MINHIQNMTRDEWVQFGLDALAMASLMFSAWAGCWGLVLLEVMS